MKAVGYRVNGPITADKPLIDFNTDIPAIKNQDILVKIEAIAVNPVDTKVRKNTTTADLKIIGYDASGTVIKIGKSVKNFKIGDEVFYAGDLTRPGTNAEFHAVDERIVGNKPTTISFAAAAAMPLTSITAWEILFESFMLTENSCHGKFILIIGGAGGVGSMLIQLAKKLTNLTVIATASRTDSVAWVKKMGADYVINHRQSLVKQLQNLKIAPDFVASLSATTQNFNDIIELIKPKGRIAIIDDPHNIDITAGKRKSLSFNWEFMFTHSMYNTENMTNQHKLLNRIANMVDNKELISTMTNNLGKINAKNLIAAHTMQEKGAVIGKNVLAGF